MHNGVLWQVIYWLSSPILTILATIMVLRKLQRSFPVFFVYVVGLYMIDFSRLVTQAGTPLTYFYVYWIGDGIGTLLALLTVGELILRRLFPQFYKLRFYRYLFLLAAVVAVSFTILTAYSSRPTILLSTLITILHTGDFFLAATLAFLVALMMFMGRRWGRYEFGIALGLGVNAAALLTTFAIFSKHLPTHGVLRELPVFGEDAASIIWLISFLRPEISSTAPTVPVSADVIQEARKWEETLKDSLTGKKRDE